MVLVGDDSPAFALEFGHALRARPIEVGQERDHDASEGRMLRFVVVSVPGEVLEAGSDVRRFISGGGEDVIGGDNARGGDGDEAEDDGHRISRQECFDGRFRRLGGWWNYYRNGRGHGPGRGGPHIGFFSGQTGRSEYSAGSYG